MSEPVITNTGANSPIPPQTQPAQPIFTPQPGPDTSFSIPVNTNAQASTNMSASSPNQISGKPMKTKPIDPVQQAIDSIGAGIQSKLPDPVTVIGAVEQGAQGNLQPIGAIGSPLISTGVSVGGDAAGLAIGEAIGGPFGALVGNIVERVGGRLVHGFALDNITNTFNKHIADIAIDMQEQGWVLGKHPLKDISRDAQFRLWRKLFHFSGGGHFADLLRDSQEAKVWAIVEPQFIGVETPAAPGTTPTLNLADLVIAVAKATIDVTF